MVKNSLKLSKINKEAEALVPKKKRKENKLKVMKSNENSEKILEEKLKKQQKQQKPRKKSGILGTLNSLAASLNDIQCTPEDPFSSKLSKKEKSLIENRDTQRFEAVLQNRQFLMNPLEAIKQHLESQYRSN